jgi:hypothetical protein
MFMNKNRPFFGSTQLRELTAIDNKDILLLLKTISITTKGKIPWKHLNLSATGLVSTLIIHRWFVIKRLQQV